MEPKLTLASFLQKYSSDDKCLDKIKDIRFPNGITCTKCKKVTTHYKIKGRMQYACSYCGTHIAPLAGTVFQKSTTSLRSWFYAMFLMINTRSGVSAKQLQRELGVTYKTAWRMFKQIRVLMADVDINPLGGNGETVEIDETYVGGKGINRMRTWRQGVEEKQKEPIMGFLQRDGKVYLKHVSGTGKWAVIEQVKNYIDPKARVMTDEWVSYIQLKKHGYFHQSINHKQMFVKGDIHTQGIENVWSHLKRGIFGVYRHVSKKYLQAYADEYAFRFNHRKSSQKMFEALLSHISSVRMVTV